MWWMGGAGNRLNNNDNDKTHPITMVINIWNVADVSNHLVLPSIRKLVRISIHQDDPMNIDRNDYDTNNEWVSEWDAKIEKKQRNEKWRRQTKHFIILSDKLNAHTAHHTHRIRNEMRFWSKIHETCATFLRHIIIWTLTPRSLSTRFCLRERSWHPPCSMHTVSALCRSWAIVFSSHVQHNVSTTFLYSFYSQTGVEYVKCAMYAKTIVLFDQRAHFGFIIIFIVGFDVGTSNEIMIISFVECLTQIVVHIQRQLISQPNKNSHKPIE